jgi:hypothetical protein
MTNNIDNCSKSITKCDNFYPKYILKNAQDNDSEKSLPVRYQKQLFQPVRSSVVDSSLCIKKNNNRTLKMNLFSSIFNDKFNAKRVSKIKMIKNFDGSIDFVIKFDTLDI